MFMFNTYNIKDIYYVKAQLVMWSCASELVLALGGQVRTDVDAHACIILR